MYSYWLIDLVSKIPTDTKWRVKWKLHKYDEIVQLLGLMISTMSQHPHEVQIYLQYRNSKFWLQTKLTMYQNLFPSEDPREGEEEEDGYTDDWNICWSANLVVWFEGNEH